jgi:SpoIID/LytB domain protein
VVLWDGTRTSIGADMAPGVSKAFTISYVSPRTAGTYTLVIDMVREGVGWFQFMGSPPHRQTLTVTTGLNAGYGASTTPPQATIGASLPLTVEVFNFGQRTWTPGAFALSYHIFTSSGGLYVWDGNRGQLPGNMPPGTSAVISVNVAMPSTTGDYIVAWDMVQEGVAWFSGVGVPRKQEPISVVPGVTFYGSGNGHGVGMSQYGAQGWATGATGAAPMTAEQIIAKYYTGVAIGPISDPARIFNRVLLSAPSSQGRFLCGDNKYFDGTLADLHTNGGMRVVDESRANLEIDRGPGDYQLVARNGKLEVWRNWPPATQIYVGDGPITVVPLDPAQPITFIQKGGAYRGNIRFTNLGGTLRVINALSYDDYTRGVLPLEMPTTWHPEALKAQAYAARTYGYSGYQGGSRDYDNTDDQADQCYGGVRVEKDTSNAAVAATAGKIITYNGASIRAYFSSSSGGYTLSDGCWMSALKQVNGVWTCSPGQPYLQPVPDPADRAVTTPNPNPRASWQATFTSDQIRDGVLRCGGPNIGVLQSVDVSNRSPDSVGHVLSVRVVGTAATANLRADDFLRTCLGLRSTMVRLSPF